MWTLLLYLPFVPLTSWMVSSNLVSKSEKKIISILIKLLPEKFFQTEDSSDKFDFKFLFYMFRYNHAIKELTSGQKESIHLKIPKHSVLNIPQLFPLPVISELGKCAASSSKRLLYSRMPEGNQISS